MSVHQFNCYQRNMYFIIIGNSRNKVIDPSNRFKYYSHPRKSKILNDMLKNKYPKMKLIAKINTSLDNEGVENEKLIKDHIN